MSRLHSSIVHALVAGVALAAGCAAHIQFERNARSAYLRGDYDSAVREAAASLRHNPGYTKSQLVIQDAFRAATSLHLDRIAEYRTSTAKTRWDGMAAAYAALVDINRTVRDLPSLPNSAAPGGFLRFDVTDYSTDLARARVDAAEFHYQEGARLASSSGETAVQRQAAEEFRAAERMVPGYKDAAARFASSQRAGTRRIAIIGFDDKTGKLASLPGIDDKIVDDIISEVMRDQNATEYVEFVTRDRVEQVMKEQQFQFSGAVDPATAVRMGRLLGAHDLLIGRVTQYLHTPPHRTERKAEVEAEVVVRTETFHDEANVERQREVKEQVKAVITILTKSSALRLSGSYSLIDAATGAVGRTESYEESNSFSDEWATYLGDKRALGKYAGLCEKAEPSAPTEAEQAYAAARSLSSSLAKGILQFLR